MKKIIFLVLLFFPFVNYAQDEASVPAPQIVMSDLPKKIHLSDTVYAEPLKSSARIIHSAEQFKKEDSPFVNYAQDELSALAPQILTSDLPKKIHLFDKELTIHWVVVDDDLIKSFFINGKKQEITESKTVVVSKKIIFSQYKNVIKVIAIDEKGNKRKKFYTVYAEPLKFSARIAHSKKEADDSLKILMAYTFRYENDDNPTNDLSSPIDIRGRTIEGVVDDEDQADNRKVGILNLRLSKGRFGLNLGYTKVDYEKRDNDNVELDVAYLSIGFNKPWKKGVIQASYSAVDINIGGFDYSLNHRGNFSYVSHRKDEGGITNHSFGFLGTFKKFADPERTDQGQGKVYWSYRNIDSELLNLFVYDFAIGNSQEGTEVTKYSYTSMMFDWSNRWDSGFKWDIGFGFQRREYKNDTPVAADTILGANRIDIPFRVSTKMGWQFSSFIIMYNYNYRVNISNKSPYVRKVHGVSIQGAI